MKSTHIIISCVLFLTACGGQDTVNRNTDIKQLNISFNDTPEGWKADFSDYTENDADYEFSSGQVELPEPLNSPVLLSYPPIVPKGFKLSSNNHSDDVFMFITKYYDGLEPNRLYEFDFELTFATNAQRNCVGIGGAPGEGVTIKIGATKLEPKSINNGNNTYSMNIDKGDQTLGGADALALGNFANDRECGNADTHYMKKTLSSNHSPFSAYTDNLGGIWLFLGTDSGFEGTSTIYFMNAKVWATKR